MNGKAVWTAPGTTFGPDAALFVIFLAGTVVKLLLANPLLLVPLATRAADMACVLDFLRNNVVAAVVVSTLDDTEKSTDTSAASLPPRGLGCTRDSVESFEGSREALCPLPW